MLILHNMVLKKSILVLLAALFAASCSTTRVLSDGEYLLRENAVLEQGKPVELGTEVNTDSVGTHKVYVICMDLQARP